MPPRIRNDPVYTQADPTDQRTIAFMSQWVPEMMSHIHSSYNRNDPDSQAQRQMVSKILNDMVTWDKFPICIMTPSKQACRTRLISLLERNEFVPAALAEGVRLLYFGMYKGDYAPDLVQRFLAKGWNPKTVNDASIDDDQRVPAGVPRPEGSQGAAAGNTIAQGDVPAGTMAPMPATLASAGQAQMPTGGIMGSAQYSRGASFGGAGSNRSRGGRGQTRGGRGQARGGRGQARGGRGGGRGQASGGRGQTRGGRGRAGGIIGSAQNTQGASLGGAGPNSFGGGVTQTSFLGDPGQAGYGGAEQVTLSNHATAARQLAPSLISGNNEGGASLAYSNTGQAGLVGSGQAGYGGSEQVILSNHATAARPIAPGFISSNNEGGALLVHSKSGQAGLVGSDQAGSGSPEPAVNGNAEQVTLSNYATAARQLTPGFISSNDEGGALLVHSKSGQAGLVGSDQSGYGGPGPAIYGGAEQAALSNYITAEHPVVPGFIGSNNEGGASWAYGAQQNQFWQFSGDNSGLQMPPAYPGVHASDGYGEFAYGGTLNDGDDASLPDSPNPRVAYPVWDETMTDENRGYGNGRLPGEPLPGELESLALPRELLSGELLSGDLLSGDLPSGELLSGDLPSGEPMHPTASASHGNGKKKRATLPTGGGNNQKRRRISKAMPGTQGRAVPGVPSRDTNPALTAKTVGFQGSAGSAFGMSTHSRQPAGARRQASRTPAVSMSHNGARGNALSFTLQATTPGPCAAGTAGDIEDLRESIKKDSLINKPSDQGDDLAATQKTTGRAQAVAQETPAVPYAGESAEEPDFDYREFQDLINWDLCQQ